MNELIILPVEKNNKTIIVIMAGTRENFYEQLKQFLK